MKSKMMWYRGWELLEKKSFLLVSGLSNRSILEASPFTCTILYSSSSCGSLIIFFLRKSRSELFDRASSQLLLRSYALKLFINSLFLVVDPPQMYHIDTNGELFLCTSDSFFARKFSGGMYTYRFLGTR